MKNIVTLKEIIKLSQNVMLSVKTIKDLGLIERKIVEDDSFSYEDFPLSFWLPDGPSDMFPQGGKSGWFLSDKRCLDGEQFLAFCENASTPYTDVETWRHPLYGLCGLLDNGYKITQADEIVERLLNCVFDNKLAGRAGYCPDERGERTRHATGGGLTPAVASIFKNLCLQENSLVSPIVEKIFGCLFRPGNRLWRMAGLREDSAAPQTILSQLLGCCKGEAYWILINARSAIIKSANDDYDVYETLFDHLRRRNTASISYLNTTNTGHNAIGVTRNTTGYSEEKIDALIESRLWNDGTPVDIMDFIYIKELYKPHAQQLIKKIQYKLRQESLLRDKPKSSSKNKKPTRPSAVPQGSTALKTQSL